jgi:hypothetical protein
VWYNHGQQAAPEAQLMTAPAETSVVATDTQATASESELEELLLRHQTAEMTQPLADDAGVSLVVYTSN